ncbi:hypothetical protein CAC42_3711 [Sphaceloma murrayae]|uniref:Sulfatase N-terminal domain-containing protein n=1 Tax=Sphaceloma murrayae TaxID=2082308 RepID=A0A2K1QGY7_9PEZI|nr:hypothetical protein CAC42_3711 [Sphaceloma murrayae]
MDEITALAQRLATGVRERGLINCNSAFAIAVVSILASKGVHIYDLCPELLRPRDLFWYGLSFFVQDTALLLLVYAGIRHASTQAPNTWRRRIALGLSAFVVSLLLILASTKVSFFFASGTQIHWRHVAILATPGAWAMFAEKFSGFIVTFGIIVSLAWSLQVPCQIVGESTFRAVLWPLEALFPRCEAISNLRSPIWDRDVQHEYQAIALQGFDDYADEALDEKHDIPKQQSRPLIAGQIVMSIIILLQLLILLLRTSSGVFTVLTWTLPVAVVVDFSPTATTFTHSAPSMQYTAIAKNETALGEPIVYPWAQTISETLHGFEDWHNETGKQYHAELDPLHISNIADPLLPGLQGKLANVKIRNVIVIMLESTSHDVFPVKEDSDFVKVHLAPSFPDGKLPAEIVDRLHNISETANFLAGLSKKSIGKRGSIHATNAFTSASYTLKSLVGTLCGINGVATDFTQEHVFHKYQPCLPQILKLFNKLQQSNTDAGPPASNWRTSFMQSVTGDFDKQMDLLQSMDFETIVTKESLRVEYAQPGGPPDPGDASEWGLPELALEQHITDAFTSARANNERVFLTHLTSTTHAFFAVPKGEEFRFPGAEDTQSPSLENIYKYLNAIGYVDSWLGRILSILEAQSALDDTLLVIQGDHGFGFPKRGLITPYGVADYGFFKIPLIFSHPNLPTIEVSDPTNSLQVMPTILDLLIETNSLQGTDRAAAQDLRDNFEAQSMLRPQRQEHPVTGRGQWHFAIINPGGSSLTVRDARRPEWHMVVPLKDDATWQLADLERDPLGLAPTKGLEFDSFVQKVKKSFGPEIGSWVEEAAEVAGWWIVENKKRWRYVKMS